jgi:hypothetical protein
MVFDSNCDRTLAILTEVFHGFPQSIQPNAEVVLQQAHDCFFPNPLPTYHLMLKGFNIDCIIQ